MGDYFGKEVFKLGFGLMRLPKLADGSMDIEQIKGMVDRFIAAGGTYFDTAYVYDGGDSERAAKEALVKRYPRDSYTLATKLNARVAKDEADAKQQLATSLERTGAGYFDYYLLHALSGVGDNYKTYEKFGLWDFVREAKAKCLVKHWGFSFHGSPELLDELLTKYPDVEFIQLQINYADWDDPRVQSRRCWEVARQHGVSVTIMEPVKGGTLANPPQAVKDILTAANPDMSPAVWAIRFAASLDGIITVLSGMSNTAQMEDNLSAMRAFRPLDDQERAVIARAQAALNAIPSIACTGCRYCVDGCPMSIPIPDIFSAMNKHLIFGQTEGAKRDYKWETRNGGKASDCVQCGQCEAACPQHLPIIDSLKQCAGTLE